MEAGKGTGPHRCLHLAEIQTLIFKRLTRSDCTRLARTCTFFYNEATNVVWSNVESWVPFIWCMPPDLVVYTPKDQLTGTLTLIDFCREPTSTDWQLFCKHAHRIRQFVHTNDFVIQSNTYSPYGEIVNSFPVGTLRLTAGMWEAITRFILQHRTIESTPSTALFPNLTTLEAHGAMNIGFPAYLPYICGDTLKNLTLSFRGLSVPLGVNRGLYNTFAELLPAMRARWPYISSASINKSEGEELGQADPEPPNPAHLEGIDIWLRDLVRLEYVRVHTGCHAPLIRALCELPILHTIDLIGGGDTIPSPNLTYPSPSIDSHFPSLKELSMNTYRPHSPLLLLQALNGTSGSSTLSKITLTFGSRTSQPSFAQAPTAIEIISRLPAVDFLDLSFGENVWRDEPVPTVPPLSTQLFAKLFGLRHMRHLSLNGFFNILLSDQDMKDTATAWPELESIRLAFSTCEFAPFTLNHLSLLTLIGVQKLYNGCPKLRKIDLPVNESLPITNDRLDLPAARPRDVSMAMIVLSLQFYPINDEFEYGSEEYMPLTIRLMFPQVTLLQTLSDRLGGTVYPAGSDGEAWVKEVQTEWFAYRNMELGDVRALLEQKWDELSGEDEDDE
ncbi:hypothetical protein BDY19DRAFT_933274 [Irpex rosettiformis]|uniref:Uncharacterized protein n=1 Tax=Irpex rosettiformis TaxID=378272 RepID=A0ACB8UA33_9APHY|nr:hypothetical protein BDY19DRAFT_933274 [Irpex rosettiformis]